MLQSPNASTLLLLCPMCAARDIFDIDPTEHGELLYCADCGHQWRPAPPPRRESPGRRPVDQFLTRDLFAHDS
jgi:Zn ribbon nucleic-acid-binding protein